MSSTPAGLPAWTRTAGIEYYGGHVNKANYLGQGSVDPRTDVTAEQIQRLSADLAALVRVAPACVALITCNDTSPAAPTVHFMSLMSNVDTDGYAGDSPASGFPALTRTGDGAFTMTFDANLEDDYSVSSEIHLIGGIGSVSKGASADVDIEASDPNADTYNERVTVKVWNNAGAVADPTLMIWLY